MNKELSIVLNELPVRGKKLTAEQIQNVFGGCRQAGQTCDGKDATCCDGMSCLELLGGSGIILPPQCLEVTH